MKGQPVFQATLWSKNDGEQTVDLCLCMLAAEDNDHGSRDSLEKGGIVSVLT